MEGGIYVNFTKSRLMYLEAQNSLFLLADAIYGTYLRISIRTITKILDVKQEIVNIGVTWNAVLWNKPQRRACGCGGIGRRAGFRCLWALARGGSTPLIRIKPVAVSQSLYASA